MENKVTKNDKIVFWISSVCFLFFFFFILSAYSPIHIFRGKYVNRWLISFFYQVRYNVYVRNTDEPRYQIYTLNNNRAELMDLRPFVPKYYFGLKRDYKPIAQEIVLISYEIPRIRYKYEVQMREQEDINNFINVDTAHFDTIYSRNAFLVRGRYLLTKEEPLNWEKDRADKNRKKNRTIMPVVIVYKQ